MKPLLYLETTIVSYLTARPTRDLVMAARQQVTIEWWNRRRGDFQVVVSPLVLAEANRGDAAAAARRLAAIRGLPLVAINDEMFPIADALLKAKLIPLNAEDDARISASHPFIPPIFCSLGIFAILPTLKTSPIFKL